MLEIEVVMDVSEDHKGTVDLPEDVGPGLHRVTLRIADQAPEPDPRTMPIEAFLEWMKIDLGPWPEGFTMRREDLYCDRGWAWF
ncbi:MAG: hypothetical protein HYU66_07495 [Armatimonadetes bacterium]|nr:hypothetical protein [Armatimonadota bacterium]